MMTASLQDIVEADKIALYIGIRICDGITDTGLCCKVYNDRNLVFIEDLLHCILVSNRRVDKCPVAAEGLDFAQALVLYIDIIIISYAVYSYDADISNILEMFMAVETRRQNVAISNRGRRCRGYRLYL